MRQACALLDGVEAGGEVKGTFYTYPNHTRIYLIMDIKQLTHWPDEIINAIASVEEANIYIRAGLKADRVGNRWALVRMDIDWVEHMGDGNNTILHHARKESEINRQQFDHEKSEYWKNRFKAFTNAELNAIYR